MNEALCLSSALLIQNMYQLFLSQCFMVMTRCCSVRSESTSKQLVRVAFFVR
jgi:hypothetical protein